MIYIYIYIIYIMYTYWCSHPHQNDSEDAKLCCSTINSMEKYGKYYGIWYVSMTCSHEYIWSACFPAKKMTRMPKMHWTSNLSVMVYKSQPILQMTGSSVVFLPFYNLQCSIDTLVLLCKFGVWTLLYLSIWVPYDSSCYCETGIHATYNLHLSHVFTHIYVYIF